MNLKGFVIFMIYMDNAATSWPKPQAVKDAIAEAINNAGNPGRGTHNLAIWSSLKAAEVRQKIASLFNIKDPLRIAFTSNATHAINIAINLCYGQILTTAMEHNSVLRPTITRGCYHIIKARPGGSLSIEEIQKSITELTGAIIMTHASNVTGEVYDIAQIGEICKSKGTLFIVDCAQTAGIVPIDVQTMNIDILCFTGHKGLFGLQGTGGIYIGPRVKVKPFMSGGTGSQSFLLKQPTELPDCYEAGTINTHGISALGAGVEYVTQIGIEKMRAIHTELWNYFINQAKKYPKIKIYGMQNADTYNAGIVSINIENKTPGEVNSILAKEGICARAGYHCAPLAHKVLCTDNYGGTVRFSMNHLNTKEEIDKVINVLHEMA